MNVHLNNPEMSAKVCKENHNLRGSEQMDEETVELTEELKAENTDADEQDRYIRDLFSDRRGNFF